MSDRQINQTNDYLSKLAKLLPAEVSGAYIFINSSAGELDVMLPVMWASLIVLMVLCPLYLWKFQGVVNWVHLAATTVAFLIWALNISSSRLVSNNHDSVVLSVVLVLYTVAMPLFVTTPKND